jgi:hypothetical protein
LDRKQHTIRMTMASCVDDDIALGSTPPEMLDQFTSERKCKDVTYLSRQLCGVEMADIDKSFPVPTIGGGATEVVAETTVLCLSFKNGVQFRYLCAQFGSRIKKAVRELLFMASDPLYEKATFMTELDVDMVHVDTVARKILETVPDIDFSAMRGMPVPTEEERLEFISHVVSHTIMGQYDEDSRRFGIEEPDDEDYDEGYE